MDGWMEGWMGGGRKEASEVLTVLYICPP